MLIASVFAATLLACVGRSGGNSEVSTEPVGIWKIQSVTFTSVNDDSYLTISQYSDDDHYVSLYIFNSFRDCVVTADVIVDSTYTFTLDSGDTYFYTRASNDMTAIEYGSSGSTTTFDLTLDQTYSPDIKDALVRRLGRTYGFCQD